MPTIAPGRPVAPSRAALPPISTPAAGAGSRASEAADASDKPAVLTKDMGPGVGVKTYTFPSRFEDVTMLRTEFGVPSSAVRGWLPPGLTPADERGETRALITFQHMGTPPDGMDAYNEAQLAVRVRDGAGEEAWHVLTMPVDSLENQRRGELIFGYPKEMSEVDVSSSRFSSRGEARAPNGELLFSLRVGPALPFGVPMSADDVNVQAFEGDNVHMDTSGEGRYRPGVAHVEIAPALRARFPGLPAEPSASLLRSGVLRDGVIELGLPREHEADRVAPSRAHAGRTIGETSHGTVPARDDVHAPPGASSVFAHRLRAAGG